MTGYLLKQHFHGSFDSKHWTWDVYFELGGSAFDWRWVFAVFVSVFVLPPLFTAIILANKSPLPRIESFWPMLSACLILFVGALLNLKIATFYLLSGFNTVSPF